MVAFRPNKTNEHQQTKTNTRHDDYDVDLHVFLWEDQHDPVEKPPVKKEAETTLVTTEATQQKKHTTHNLYIFIRCHFGPLLFALVFAPYIYPAILHRCSHLTGFHSGSLLCRVLLAIHIVANGDVLRHLR